jgi:hypothetical protein
VEVIMRRVPLFITLTVVGASALTAPPPGARPAAAPDYFVVDTQFIEGADNEIVDSGGSFAGCTTVFDLWGGGEQTGPNSQVFFGDKEVTCPDGTVTVHYVAERKGSGTRRTTGYWYVVESTVPGISEGFGSVRGDASRCTPLPEAGGCIIDTFAGTTG